MLANLISTFPMALCLLLGAGLVILEVFLPGFGLPGISGIVLIGVGTVIAGSLYGMMAAVAILLVVIAVLALVVSWILHSASRGGVQAEIFLHDKEELHTQKDMQVLIGKRGKAISSLRPAGIGDFDGVRLNVVTEGGFVEKDAEVEIIRVDGAKIVVRGI